jgi:hypothetical protein
MDSIDIDEGSDGAEGKASAGMAVSDTAKRMANAKAASDGRAKTSAVNGAAGGRPKGISTPNADKRTYDDEKLAKDFADRLLNGGPLPVSRAGPPTREDREHVARITGVTVEEFQSKFLQRLMTIADKAANHIEERLDEGGQRLSDLNMTLAISVDKMAAISGRTAQAGNVSVTVNNYGAMSRAEMLAVVERDAKASARANSIEIQSQ